MIADLLPWSTKSSKIRSALKGSNLHLEEQFFPSRVDLSLKRQEKKGMRNFYFP